MPKSDVDPRPYEFLRRMLIELRRRQGVSQSELAEKLGRRQSFVSNIEHGVRRLDVVEFCAIVWALDTDPVVMLAELVAAYDFDRKPGT